MTYDEEMERDTTRLIDELRQKTGIDWSAGRTEIRTLVESQMSGNWDNTTDFDPALGLRDFRVIQEDEYDQSMDEDEKPDWDTMVMQASLGYVWLNW